MTYQDITVAIDGPVATLTVNRPDKLNAMRNESADEMRAALAELDSAGKSVTFVDIRTEADLKKKVPLWLAAAGPDKLVNKRSTTWRGMTDAEKEAALTEEGAVKVLCALPTLIKRPVVEAGGAVHTGWKQDTRTALLGE